MRQSKQSQFENVLEENLGIHLDKMIFEYMYSLFETMTTNPKEIERRIVFIPKLIRAIIPNPEYSQKKIAQLLLRLEIMMRCLRIVLEHGGNDLFERMIESICEPIEAILPEDRPPTRAELKRVTEEVNLRMSDIRRDLKKSQDPQLRAALFILSNFPTVLDIQKPLRISKSHKILYSEKGVKLLTTNIKRKNRGF